MNVSYPRDQKITKVSFERHIGLEISVKKYAEVDEHAVERRTAEFER